MTQKSGEGETTKVTVKFAAPVGEKRLVVKYAKLKKINERPALAPAEGEPVAAAPAEAPKELKESKE